MAADWIEATRPVYRRSNFNPFVPNASGEINISGISVLLRTDRERAKRLCEEAGQDWSRFQEPDYAPLAERRKGHWERPRGNRIVFERGHHASQREDGPRAKLDEQEFLVPAPGAVVIDDGQSIDWGPREIEFRNAEFGGGNFRDAWRLDRKRGRRLGFTKNASEESK